MGATPYYCDNNTVTHLNTFAINPLSKITCTSCVAPNTGSHLSCPNLKKKYTATWLAPVKN
ncbi:MAG: hypothetical protein H7334_04590 [Ferruginibacter sp.]|nr:hypothetical protein [Ferruginibacter sp.]